MDTNLTTFQIIGVIIGAFLFLGGTFFYIRYESRNFKAIKERRMQNRKELKSAFKDLFKHLDENPEEKEKLVSGVKDFLGHIPGFRDHLHDKEKDELELAKLRLERAKIEAEISALPSTGKETSKETFKGSEWLKKTIDEIENDKYDIDQLQALEGKYGNEPILKRKIEMKRNQILLRKPV